MHFFYMFTIIFYVNKVYIDNSLGKDGSIFTILLGIGISYPAIYDTTQLIKLGPAYFSDIWNYSDFIYIWSSILNIGL